MQSPGSGPPSSGGVTRDDAAAMNALTGERMEPPASSIRWVFDPDGVFRLVDHTNPDACTSETGTWTLIEGLRYSDNGGGVIARVQTKFDTAREFTIQLPNAMPDGAIVDGEQFTRSRSLPGSC